LTATESSATRTAGGTSQAARRQIRPPDPEALARVVASALAEDLAFGDPTTEGLFGPEAEASMSLLVKEPGVVCGLPIVAAVFAALSPAVAVAPLVADGDRVATTPAEIARITGPTRAILSGERTALNLLGRLSGIATLTARCVAELDGTGAALLDTRKTTAGLRELEKYAVRCGGGTNHRLNLGEALLVKDNHLRLAGGIATAVARLRGSGPRLRLEVEAETLEDVQEALDAGVNRILLDNMSLDELRRAVAMAGGRVETEASGGITLENLRAVGETGVDFVSLGALTHSARALDVSLEVAD
jgi:nicotinate-nucleotide pyrophosphorylase (carboxylating)